MDLEEKMKMKEQEKSLNENLSRVVALIRNKNYIEAKKILSDYLDYTLPFVREDNENRYFSFRDSIEFYAAVRVLSITKNAIWTRFKMSYVYNLLMFIANEEKEFEKAMEYAKEALYYNPMDSNLYFEASETYKFLKDYESMAKITREAYPILFDSNELARFYRNLGFYYTETKKYDIAFALYVMSLNYDVTDVAYHEIAYIREQLNNKGFTLTKQEIVDILDREKISIGISKNNIKILEDFITDVEANKNDFGLISSAKGMLRKVNVTIQDTDELLNINIMPSISTDDMFDDKKNILTDKDKEIKEKNVEFIKVHNYEYLTDMKGLPINRVTTLKEKEEIVYRMVREYAIATISMYAVESKFSIIPYALESMNAKLSLQTCLNIKDFDYINAIQTGKVSKRELDDLTWMFESVKVFMWILGISDKPDYTKECDVVEMDKFFISINSLEELKSKCKLIDKYEILEYLDLISRLNYSVTSSALKGIKTDLNPSIIREHKLALEWTLNFKLESLMNDEITIKYKKNNFNFTFKTPSTIHIKELLNIKKPKNIISLSNTDDSTMLTLVRVCKLDNVDFENRVNIDIEEYKNFGWTIIDTKEINTKNIGKVFEAYLNVTLEDNKPEFGIVKYYFKLNGYIVALESLLEKNIDYSIESLEKSNNKKMAYNLIKSIKEEEITIDVPVLNGFEKTNSTDPKIILEAKSNAFTQTLLKEKTIKKDENIEDVIKEVIQKEVDSIKLYSSKNDENSIFYYKDIKAKFDFKLYVEDIYYGSGNNMSILRRLNAYFVNEKDSSLYRISLSVGPFKFPTERLILGHVSNDDELTNNLINMFIYILENTKSL